MYSSRFVMSVLLNGKPQKERHDGIVTVPFGSEYALRFRNKNDRRAVVTFTIDGENVSGDGYVINPNSYVDILRHYSHDARFKFVSSDSEEAVDFGKNGPNDGTKGVIEAKFYLEKPRPVKPVEHHHHHHHYPPYTPPYNPWKPYPVWSSGPQIGSSGDPGYYECSKGGLRGLGGGMSAGTTCSTGGGMELCSLNAAPASCDFEAAAAPTLKDGVTVEGTMSGQTFYTVEVDLETECVTLRLVLKGGKASKKGTEAAQQINESTAMYCTGCGAKRARKRDKFCGACGKRF